MMSRAVLRVAFAACLVLGVVVGGEAVRAGSPVITTLDAKTTEALFRDLGYTGIEVGDDGDLMVRIQGMKVLVLVGSSQGTSIQLRFAITGSDATLERINTWNKTKMYSRAYLDDDGDPVLEAEQDLAGGVTEDRLKDFIMTFGVSLATFLNEVV